MHKATEEDKIRTRKIISEEYRNINPNMTDKELDERVIDVLDTSYSIGGGYDVYTIREIIQALIEKNY